MDNDSERVFGCCLGEWATLRQLLRAQQPLHVCLGEDAAFDPLVSLDELEVLAPVQPAIMKNETRKEMLHHQVVQNHDPGMLLAETPDRVVITRVVPHL